MPTKKQELRHGTTAALSEISKCRVFVKSSTVILDANLIGPIITTSLRQ